MASYEYDLTKSVDLEKLDMDLTTFSNLFSTKEFREFIADKCLEELKDIQNYSLVTFDEHSVFDAKVQEYERNHKVEYGDDYIIIFNDTNMEQSEMFWVKPETLANYPNGISVAYIIEYGTGIKGTSQEDWQTNVNNHGAKGWSYLNPDGSGLTGGKYVWTTGLEGRFIYQKLLESVEKHIESWVNEYAEKEGW